MTPDEAFQQFARDPGRREKLSTALADPVLQEAFALVEELMEPKIGMQADAAPAIAASYYHQVAGANYFRKKLRDLTREPVERKTPQLKKFAKTIDDLPKD